MGTADLTVQRLRLQAPRAAAGLLHKVEDALRVSSKPAGRMDGAYFASLRKQIKSAGKKKP